MSAIEPGFVDHPGGASAVYNPTTNQWEVPAGGSGRATGTRGTPSGPRQAAGTTSPTTAFQVGGGFAPPNAARLPSGVSHATGPVVLRMPIPTSAPGAIHTPSRAQTFVSMPGAPTTPAPGSLLHALTGGAPQAPAALSLSVLSAPAVTQAQAPSTWTPPRRMSVMPQASQNSYATPGSAPAAAPSSGSGATQGAGSLLDMLGGGDGGGSAGQASSPAQTQAQAAPQQAATQGSSLLDALQGGGGGQAAQGLEAQGYDQSALQQVPAEEGAADASGGLLSYLHGQQGDGQDEAQTQDANPFTSGSGDASQAQAGNPFTDGAGQDAPQGQSQSALLTALAPSGPAAGEPDFSLSPGPSKRVWFGLGAAALGGLTIWKLSKARKAG